MAIDPNNPLLNGPRRVDARPVVRLAPLAEQPALVVAAPGVQPVSEAEIMGARTPKGSWTRATLAQWGVSWPPPQGWKERLIKGLPQEPPREKAQPAQLPLLGHSGPGGRIPGPLDPDFDSTKHGLLAPPRVTYRRREE